MRIINRFPIKSILTIAIRTNFCNYKFPYNINQQQNTSYLKKVERAEQQMQRIKQSNPVPRRKRRIYDRPKHDLDISNYSAWRIYDPEEMLHKFWAHGAPVVAKLQLQPKWVIHAFGMGLPPMNHEKSANLQFSFEDNNFSKYLLYEYRNTTAYEPNVQGYNYAEQSHLPQKMRKIFRLNPQQFWKSEDYFEFRLNCSAYAEHLKFKKWVIQTIQSRKSKESYDEFINKKFGHILTFNNKEDVKHYQPLKPMLLSVGPQHYVLPKKGQKIKEARVDMPKKLEQKYRILPKKTQTPKKEEQKKSAQANLS